MSIERDVTARKELERSTAEPIAREQQSKDERRLLTLMSEWLYSAKSIDEALMVIRRSLETLFPSHHGSLYIFANSRNVLDLVATWGESEGLGTMPPPQVQLDGCWSLRRGRAYHFGSAPIEFACEHVEQNIKQYFCIPIVAHGETIGLLHLVPDGIAVQNLATDWQQRWGLEAVSKLEVGVDVRAEV